VQGSYAACTIIIIIITITKLFIARQPTYCKPDRPGITDYGVNKNEI